MTKPIWNKGKPPSNGWWPASSNTLQNCYRWYDGRCWSYSVTESFSAITAAHIANMTLSNNESKFILWKQRPKSWPARSCT